MPVYIKTPDNRWIPYPMTPATGSSLKDATFGNYTKTVLANPDGVERGTALRQWLVQPTRPIIHDAAVYWTYIQTAIAPSPFAQDPGDSPSADDETSNQQLKEAADIYYSNNQFIVRLELLDNFLYDTNGAMRIPGLVVSLIRDLTVVITTGGLDKISEKEGEEMVKQLQYLFGCKNLEKLAIEICGGGDMAGTDWSTQEIIRIIAPVVKGLKSQFNTRLSISKVSPDGASRNITQYWSLSDGTAKSSFDSCTATSDQIMRVQTYRWANPKQRSLLSGALF
ncbi:hypothetical protein TGAMA5MH_10354 [Trichoderma gamsii]|uniref:Uncharacterized protein n=1 Tax=Trichoderma gamsii TaxID=398673 RepID=A0A2K0SWU7_9HYPO|nr:hypothetical protein TGAMA5MH_10354 [Trichoderma gamsii]